MSHPSLGLPPRDPTSGFAAEAARLHAAEDRLAARAFEVALDADPTLRERYDETGLRRLMRDTRTMLEVLERAVAAGDPGIFRGWAEQAVPPYRRRAVPMDDLINLARSIRSVVDAALSPAAFAVADDAIERAIEVFKWHRRIGGDARRRNKLLAFLYKGA